VDCLSRCPAPPGWMRRGRQWTVNREQWTEADAGFDAGGGCGSGSHSRRRRRAGLGVGRGRVTFFDC
jgi:hypothetical protein